MTMKNDVSSAERPSSKKTNKSKCFIVKYITVLSWLPKYSQFDGVSDLVAGISLGLTVIPQSIAYAALARLTAQYGLYSCFVGAFVYPILGTIKEVSIGPSSLMSLLTLEYTRNMPVDFIVLFCFLAGCVELLMGLFRLGFLVDFISIPVTSGFTSATSIIIIATQLQGLLGLKFKADSVVDNLVKISKNIQNVRLPDFALGLSSIAFLLFFRKLKDFNCCVGKDDSGQQGRTVLMKKVLWFLSICRNALVILIASTIAFCLEKRGGSPFILSGKIVSGLPTMALPPFSSQVGNQTYTFVDMCYQYGTGLIVLPLVSVLANVSIAKAYASGSTVNATQEMLTLGLCNIIGSFFSSMPTAGAFTRSAVVSASGVRTPLAGLYVGIMSLLALSFLTPYFYYIPRATLAAVLISAVIFLIDLRIIKLLWNGCKRDAIAATVTFLVSVIFGVEVGLLIGAIFNLIYIIRPSARPQIEMIECKTQLGNKYIMLKPDSGLFYPAANYFCNKIVGIANKYAENNIPIIVNCERIRNIDYTSIKSIEVLSRNMNAEKKRLWFLNVHPDTFESIGSLANSKNFSFIHDEDNIPEIFYDGTFTGNAEEGKEKLLENSLANATFTSVKDNEKSTETFDKIVTKLEDGAEETAFTLSPSSKT
ncbi:PREDICTED: sodium-independent sulfate anion transporter-like [Dufourea novaeangliae]|uniref:sodium-independent sulfate anion transporter-like n=1 Tax=Dufourea novaeangliae TaxID=178035 RepID=UPI0007673FC2|nr:PREDICTED: sodium-independent sulfate anion transporter-like [Dufourea novaeangliae]